MQSAFKRAVRGFVGLSFRRPLAVILTFVLVGGLSGFLASRLIFRGDFAELLPDNAKEVRDLELVSKKAGGDGYLVVQVKGTSPEQLRKFAHEVAPEIEKDTSEVRYVEYHYDIEFFRKHALLLLPVAKLQQLRTDMEARILYEKQLANPLFVDLGADEPPPTFAELEKKFGSDAPQNEYLTSQDGKELYLFVKPTGLAGDLGYSKRLLEKVDEACKRVAKGYAGLSTDYTGAYRIRLEEDAMMKKDLSMSSVLSALIAILLIVSATRRASALMVVGAPVLIGVSMTFALTQVTIGYLNVVTGFLVAILIGLGIEYGIHLSMRYWEERRLRPAEDAMVAAFGGTFSGALTSALTNAAAFLVLVFAKFHAFVQFGAIAGGGVLLSVVAAYALGPAIIALAERIRPLKSLTGEKVDAIKARNYGRVPLTLVITAAVAVLGVAAYSLSVAKNVGFENDLRKLKGDSPATRLDDHIAEQMGAKITPAILYVDGIDQAQKVTALIDDIKKRHGDKSAFHKAASLNELVPRDVENRRAEIEKIRPLIEDLPESMKEGETGEKLESFRKLLDAKPYGVDDLPLEIRRRFQSLDGKGMFVLLFPRYSGYNTAEIQLWAQQLDELRQRASEQSVEVAILDGNLIAARIFSLVKADGPFILSAAAIVIFVMIFLSLRSLKKTLLVAGPLFLGLTCMVGGMHLFGVQLNFINAAVLPSLMAIAVDNSVHLFHRYEEEGPGSLGHIMRTTGVAAVVASMSNGAGYGALLIAKHAGLRSTGQIAVLGVVGTFIGTTIFFPTLLTLLERWRFRKGGPGAGAGDGIEQAGRVAVLPMPGETSSPATDEGAVGKKTA